MTSPRPCPEPVTPLGLGFPGPCSPGSGRCGFKFVGARAMRASGAGLPPTGSAAVECRSAKGRVTPARVGYGTVTFMSLTYSLVSRILCMSWIMECRLTNKITCKESVRPAPAAIKRLCARLWLPLPQTRFALSASNGVHKQIHVCLALCFSQEAKIASKEGIF